PLDGPGRRVGAAPGAGPGAILYPRQRQRAERQLAYSYITVLDFAAHKPEAPAKWGTVLRWRFRLVCCRFTYGHLACGTRLRRGVCSEECAEAQPEDDAQGTGRLLEVHLRRPGAAILEDDRRFADAAAGLAAAVEHLLLERVAARQQAVEVDLAEL